MDLIQAYNLYNAKLKESSSLYSLIIENEDDISLSVLYFLKCYKKYIITCDILKKPTTVVKLNVLDKLQSKSLYDLLCSLVILTERLKISAINVLKKEDKLVDPTDIIDIILKDHITTSLSDDLVYERYVRAAFNLIADKEFDKTLKDLFLKYTNIKKI